MKRWGIVAGTASAVVLAGLVSAGIAQARSSDDPAVTVPHGAELILTVAPSGVGTPTTLILRCAPLGGTHPHAAPACAALAAAHGRIAHLTPTPGARCPQLVNPVRGTAQWDVGDKAFRYDHTWNDPCEMHRATGELFDF